MSQFTSPRGHNPVLVEGEIVYDGRVVESERRPDGVLEHREVGVVVTVVRPRSNDTTASVFVNDEKVRAAIPYDVDADENPELDEAVASVLDELGIGDSDVEEEEDAEDN